MGRAGIEEEYDRYLRGPPRLPEGRGRLDGPRARRRGRGAGRVPATRSSPRSTPASRASTERALHDAITTARATYDPVTHRNYRADSGAAIVLQAKTGRVVAMASQPTYDPSPVGRRHHQQAAGPALLGEGRRPAAGAGVPGPVRARLDLEADHDRRRVQQRLRPGAPGSTARPASRSATGSSTTTSPSRYGMIDFAKALQVSCDTFFYRVGYHFWQKFGQDPTNVNARDPLVAEAKAFGFGRPTGIDVPGEASGRIADRHWKLAYWKSMKSYYCGIDQHPPAGDQRLPQAVRPRVLPRGQLLPGRRRGELRDRAGRHAGHAAPARPGVRRARQRRHALRAADRQGDRQPRAATSSGGSSRRSRRT